MLLAYINLFAFDIGSDWFCTFEAGGGGNCLQTICVGFYLLKMVSLKEYRGQSLLEVTLREDIGLGPSVWEQQRSVCHQHSKTPPKCPDLWQSLECLFPRGIFLQLLNSCCFSRARASVLFHTQFTLFRDLLCDVNRNPRCHYSLRGSHQLSPRTRAMSRRTLSMIAFVCNSDLFLWHWSFAVNGIRARNASLGTCHAERSLLERLLLFWLRSYVAEAIQDILHNCFCSAANSSICS